MWLVVGLGNPGREYERNRHNVGFRGRRPARRPTGARFGRHRRAIAEVAEARLGLGVDARQLVLVKPMTYMNLSGGPVAGLASFYKVPAGADHRRPRRARPALRAGAGQVGGGEGGHNGLRSMSQSLSTKDYLRVRFGIGRPPGRQDPADYVLSDFSRRRAQGARVPGRPQRRHRRVDHHARPRGHPERVPRRRDRHASTIRDDPVPRLWRPPRMRFTIGPVRGLNCPYRPV